MRKRFPKTRYVVEVWSGGRESTIVQTFTGYNLASAKRRADSAMRALPTIFTTWELRGYSYEAFASVLKADRTQCLYHAYQDVRFVNSIADDIREKGYAIV